MWIIFPSFRIVARKDVREVALPFHVSIIMCCSSLVE